MVCSSKTSCSIPFKSRQQPRLCLFSLLFLSSLCSHKTGVKIGCLERGASIVGILLGEILPLSFLPRPLCFRAIRGSQGLSDYSYRVVTGHFSPCYHPEGFWLLHRIQKAKGVAMGATSITSFSLKPQPRPTRIVFPLLPFPWVFRVLGDHRRHQ